MTMQEARARNVENQIGHSYNESITDSETSPLLTPLSTHDKEYFTIRINTYRRNEQLLISLNHHSQCEGVALIQVIWCDYENEPPDEIKNHPSGKVEIEYHSINTLNERFNIVNEPPTLGILSLDDDVLRPCLALDAGFFKWTLYPHRMVGYDGRIHLEDDSSSKWSYGYLSSAQKTNTYSLTLTRFAFIHRDYLHLYYNNDSAGALPNEIFEMVADNLNCEDIAMSFFVSSLTCGNPPFLAQAWAVDSLIKLHTYSGSISSNKNHKSIRDECVDTFAELLNLKGREKLLGENNCIDSPRLKSSTTSYSNTVFKHGALPEEWEKRQSKENNKEYIPRKDNFLRTVNSWEPKTFNEEFKEMMDIAEAEARSKGLIAHTEEWKKRWNIKDD